MQNIVFYGNCQALWLKANTDLVAGALPEANIQTTYVFSDSPQAEQLLAASVRSATHLVFQSTRATPHSPEQLRRQGLRVANFPALYFRPMYPFAVMDRRSGEGSPIAIGDARVLDMQRHGLSYDDIMRIHPEEDVGELRDIDAIYEDQVRRWRRMESFCDLKVADWIERNFQDQCLFELYWHPTQPVYRRLGEQLWDFLDWSRPLREVSSAIYDFFPMEVHRMPVHPSVARRLKLSWWSGPDHQVIHLGRPTTFRDWLHEYLTYDGRNVVTLPSAPRQPDAIAA